MRSLMWLALLLCVGAQPAEGQWGERIRERIHERMREHMDERRGPGVELGLRGGYDFEDETGTAGAQVLIPVTRHLRLVPSGDVYLEDSATDWQVNADLVVAPEALGGVYAGVGGALARRDFEGQDDAQVEAGYNLLVGLQGEWVLGTALRPFVEARWTEIDDYDPFRLLVGVNVPITGGRR